MQVSEREIAERIVDALFTNGMGEKADRLMLVLPGGKDGGGWCRIAVVDVILRNLVPPTKEMES